MLNTSLIQPACRLAVGPVTLDGLAMNVEAALNQTLQRWLQWSTQEFVQVNLVDQDIPRLQFTWALKNLP